MEYLHVYSIGEEIHSAGQSQGHPDPHPANPPRVPVRGFHEPSVCAPGPHRPVPDLHRFRLEQARREFEALGSPPYERRGAVTDEYAWFSALEEEGKYIAQASAALDTDGETDAADRVAALQGIVLEVDEDSLVGHPEDEAVEDDEAEGAEEDDDIEAEVAELLGEDDES